MKKLVLFTAMILSSFALVVAQSGMGYHGQGQQGGNTGYNYGANVGPPVMNQQEFSSALQHIRSQSFEDGKLRVAKQVTRGNALRSNQVKRVARQFSFESTRLKFAKFAYQRVSDPHNYYVVNEAFSFSSSVRNLDRFIASRGAPVQQSGASCGTGYNSGGNSNGSYQSGTLTVSGGIRPADVGHQGGNGNVGYNSGASGGGYYGGSHGGMASGSGHPGMMVAFSQDQFECVLRDMRRISFDREKLAYAKKKICNRSITSRQVKRMMKQFSFEGSRLELAKSSYLQTCDKQNYYIVNDAFCFSSSVRKLECYIATL